MKMERDKESISKHGRGVSIESDVAAEIKVLCTKYLLEPRDIETHFTDSEGHSNCRILQFMLTLADRSTVLCGFTPLKPSWSKNLHSHRTLSDLYI